MAMLRLALSGGLGPCRFAQLSERFGAPADALAGLIEMRRKDVRVATERDAEKTLASAKNIGAEVLLRGDAGYPDHLAQIARPPLMLFSIGDQTLLNGRLVAIVGARNASVAARRFAEDLASGLSEAGIGVVSGLARGIDAAAHRGSIEGRPVGVVAGGVDVVYPRENADIQRQIAERGVLLAESPMGAKPTERHFPRRNRIVAGLAVAVVIIEAAERSGSLITARFALEEGREVMAVPGFPSDPRSAGGNRLIREGAALIRTADDVLAALPDGSAFQPFRRKGQQPLDLRTEAPPSLDATPSEDGDPLSVVRASLAAAPITVDELGRECQLSASAVASALQELELLGEIERLPGQRVALL